MRKLEQNEITNSLKDIQELTKTFENIRDFSKLSEELGKKYGNKSVKTSNLTTVNSLFTKGETYTLKTPFGSVRVESDSNTGELMIYPKGKSTPPTYDVIALKLDNLFTDDEKDLSPQEIIVGVVDPIINYLKQSTSLPQEKLKGQGLLNKITGNTSPRVNFSFLENDQIEAAAVLCGILMLSESNQIRNPTLGKFERSSMKRVKQLASKGYSKPFSKVFLNKTGEYIPAHDYTSDLETYIRGSGGSVQTQMIINTKISHLFLNIILNNKNNIINYIYY